MKAALGPRKQASWKCWRVHHGLKRNWECYDGKEIWIFAQPMGCICSSPGKSSPCSRRCMPSRHYIRAASLWDWRFERMKKLRAVIGAAICRGSRANTRSGHDAAQVKLVPKASSGRTSRRCLIPANGCCEISVLCRLALGWNRGHGPSQVLYLGDWLHWGGGCGLALTRLNPNVSYYW
jgi:hypothetical protein